MESLLFTLWIMVLAPVVTFFFLRRRLAGRMLCTMLEKDRSVRNILVKVAGDFVFIEGDRYFVNPEAVRIVRYPGGWPTPFQHPLPNSLYQRDGAQPIDWNTQRELSQSAKEVTAALDPHLFSAIVKGTREGGSSPIGNLRPVFIILGGISIVILLTLFYTLSKISDIQSASGVVG